MTRRLSAILAASLVAAFVPASAGAEVLSCEFNPQTRELSIEFEGTAVIERQSGSSNIRVDGIVCAAPDLSANATVQTVDTIRVEGSLGDENLIVSLANGPFAPGATAEVSPQGPASEIEWSVSLRQGTDVLEIIGSPGADRITFGAGSTATNQRAVATNQDNDAEFLVAGEQAFVASGGNGPDRLQGAGGHGTGSVTPTPLTLLGEDGKDTLFGGLGDDGLNAGFGFDTLQGLAGDDSVQGGPDTDVATGGSGDDVLENEAQSASGVPGRDKLFPGPGNDVVIGSGPGSNPETVSYENATGPVNVNLQDESATGEGSDTLIFVDNAIGSNFDDVLQGTPGLNRLEGRRGRDELRGAEGADVLIPGRDDDTVRGGADHDTVSFGDSPSGVDVDLTLGRATGEGTDTLVAVESALGSQFPDELTGSAVTNELQGQGGNDDLFGLDGDDGLFGDEGNDDLDGGPGTDTCNQGTGTGTLTLCENVGTFELNPRRAQVAAGERLDYLLTWTHPRRWRRLDTVELRVRDGSRVLVWVRWNQEGNTFQLFDPGGDRFVSGEARAPGNLRSPFAVLHLRGSHQVVFDERTIGVLMRLSFREAAAGSHIVEATAEDDRNNRMAWERAGTLKVVTA